METNLAAESESFVLIKKKKPIIRANHVTVYHILRMLLTVYICYSAT